jgi:hypothetical protein
LRAGWSGCRIRRPHNFGAQTQARTETLMARCVCAPRSVEAHASLTDETLEWRPRRPSGGAARCRADSWHGWTHERRSSRRARRALFLRRRATNRRRIDGAPCSSTPERPLRGRGDRARTRRQNADGRAESGRSGGPKDWHLRPVGECIAAALFCGASQSIPPFHPQQPGRLIFGPTSASR